MSVETETPAIRDPDVVRLIERLAAQRGLSPEAALRLALEQALAREPARPLEAAAASPQSLAERLGPLQEQLAEARRRVDAQDAAALGVIEAAIARDGRPAPGKAFFDDLSDGR